MTFEEAKRTCHVRSAIYRTGDPTKIFTEEDLQKIHPALRDLNEQKVGTVVPKRYNKNHSLTLDEQVPDVDKQFDDWQEYDPREHDNCSLAAMNDQRPNNPEVSSNERESKSERCEGTGLVLEI